MKNAACTLFDPADFFSTTSEKGCTGKFVQLETGSGDVLLIGLLSRFPYHADLVAAFGDANGLHYRRPSLQEKTSFLDPAILIHGGGWVDADPVGKRLRFYGHSTAYGSFDKKKLEFGLEQLGIGATWSILIDS